MISRAVVSPIVAVGRGTQIGEIRLWEPGLADQN